MSDRNIRYPGEAFALHCPMCDSVHIAEMYVIETNGDMDGVQSRARGSWRCCECGHMLPEMGLNKMYDILDDELIEGTQKEKDFYMSYGKNSLFSYLFSAMFKMWKKERDGEGKKDE